MPKPLIILANWPFDMHQELNHFIEQTARDFADRRICHFDVRVESVEAGRAKLIGSVLEQSNREALRRTFAQSLPGLKLDDSGVRVLRTDAPPIIRTVATSLTDLRREPSWLAERMTQVLNGHRLEVLDERERWAFIRQPSDGYLGWIYGSYLTESPPIDATHLICNPSADLFDSPAASAPLLTRLCAATRVRQISVDGERAQIQCAGAMLPHGWIARAALRAIASFDVSPDALRRRMMADARRYFGSYYLWGGCTAWGLDCSGLCQLVHRLSGIEIPRDADMQFAAGRIVEGPPFEPGDLLFFGGESTASDKRKVTHVGLATGQGWNMIHASRSRNGVYEDDVEQIEHLRTSYAGARSFVASR